MKFIETREELRTVYREAKGGAVLKELKKLDPHAKGFLSRSPFLVMGSQDAEGNADTTPRGDKPGFVKVLDDTTIAIPDRPGNNRLDTWPDRSETPTLGQIMSDQLALAQSGEELDENLAEGYRKSMW